MGDDPSVFCYPTTLKEAMLDVKTNPSVYAPFSKEGCTEQQLQDLSDHFLGEYKDTLGPLKPVPGLVIKKYVRDVNPVEHHRLSLKKKVEALSSVYTGVRSAHRQCNKEAYATKYFVVAS